jgi:predicted nucleic-acid-binding protein
MISIDTNVVVRFLMGDDPQQFRRADTLIRDYEVFVSLTVLLETEWVLRDRLELSRRDVAKALRDFARLPNVIIEDAPRASLALGWAEQGMDFADALHLASKAGAVHFVSFDKKLAKLAARLGAPEVRAP